MVVIAKIKSKKEIVSLSKKQRNFKCQNQLLKNQGEKLNGVAALGNNLVVVISTDIVPRLTGES